MYIKKNLITLFKQIFCVLNIFVIKYYDFLRVYDFW